MRYRAPLLLLAALALSAPLAGKASAQHQLRSRNPDVITLQEIRASHHADALTMIQSLRPLWLRTRGVSSLYLEHEGRTRVYVDNVPMGGVEVLRNISADVVSRLEYMDGRTATQRFGTNHPNGAILVRTGG